MCPSHRRICILLWWRKLSSSCRWLMLVLYCWLPTVFSNKSKTISWQGFVICAFYIARKQLSRVTPWDKGGPFLTVLTVLPNALVYLCMRIEYRMKGRLLLKTKLATPVPKVFLWKSLPHNYSWPAQKLLGKFFIGTCDHLWNLRKSFESDTRRFFTQCRSNNSIFD